MGRPRKKNTNTYVVKEFDNKKLRKVATYLKKEILSQSEMLKNVRSFDRELLNLATSSVNIMKDNLATVQQYIKGINLNELDQIDEYIIEQAIKMYDERNLT